MNPYESKENMIQHGKAKMKNHGFFHDEKPYMILSQNGKAMVKPDHEIIGEMIFQSLG